MSEPRVISPDAERRRLLRIIKGWVPRADEILASPEFNEWREAVHPQSKFIQGKLSDVHVYILQYLSWRIDQEAGFQPPPHEVFNG